MVRWKQSIDRKEGAWVERSMGKTLIITEKPSVAREYATILKVKGAKKGCIENESYVITWCVGHLIEMSYPEVYDPKYKKWSLEDLPFLPETYRYAVIPTVKQQYEIVHELLHRSDISLILYAGDSGREGQVIIELLRRFSGVRNGVEERRVWIDSCTEEEITRGIAQAKPIEAYDALANAGMMRAIEDYAMGINFSRVLSIQYGRMLNKAANHHRYAAIAIGRVMTCVLGMVVRREREIRSFQETTFYRLQAEFEANGIVLVGDWKATEQSTYAQSPLLYKENGFLKKKDAESFRQILKKEKYGEVVSAKKTTEKKKPPLLFNLAELQAECTKRFKISPDETLKIAQELYEKKLITYPRTDARVLSTAVATQIQKNLSALCNYSPTKHWTEKVIAEKKFVSLPKTMYTNDQKITDHYAMIPTGYTKGIEHLGALQKKVYDRIVRRFLSIFYPAASYQKLQLVIAIQKEHFFVTKKQLKVAGYLEVMQEETQEEQGENASFFSLQCKKGDRFQINDISLKEGKTTPPKRYTSGSMILAMENAGKLIEEESLREQIKGAGIGTSATRAEIIEKLIRIGYLQLQKKTQILTPKKFGEMVYEVVQMTIPSMLNPEMTASWEKGLASMEQGQISLSEYREKLDGYVLRYTNWMKQHDLSNWIAKKIEPFAEGEGYEQEGCTDYHKIGVCCPVCGGEMQTTPFGYGCSNYRKKGVACDFTIGPIAKRKLSEQEVVTLLTTEKLGPLSGFRSKNNRIFSATLHLEEREEKDGKKKKVIVFSFTK